LSDLHHAGYETADQWLARHRDKLGKQSSLDVKQELVHKVLKPDVTHP